MSLMPKICALASLLLLISGEGRAADIFPGINPDWLLLHEPAVVAEIKLSSTERKAFQDFVDELDLSVFPLRNKSRDEMLPAVTKVFAKQQQGLKAILRPQQQKRLNEIYIRWLGTRALLRDDVSGKLRYSDAQRNEITRIIDDTRTSVEALEKAVNEGQPREPLEKELVALKTEELKQVLKLLKPQQQSAWRDLAGPAFDMTKLGLAQFKAPDLADTNEWINSKPLRLEDLRGKVVVVHFYAFGCINCIHNYPWYHQWHDAFKDKGVVLIGIHTPETDSEREVENVKRKAAAEKFAFPILIDGRNENWNAWGNSMWPSVYLIDKRGYVRQFWPGELNWQGNNGEKHMREWIEKLVAEKD